MRLRQILPAVTTLVTATLICASSVSATPPEIRDTIKSDEFWVDSVQTRVDVITPFEFASAELRLRKRSGNQVWTETLPGGINLSADLGEITGAPLENGRYTYEIRFSLPGNPADEAGLPSIRSFTGVFEVNGSEIEGLAPNFATASEGGGKFASGASVDATGAETRDLVEAGDLLVDGWGIFGDSTGTVIDGKVQIRPDPISNSAALSVATLASNDTDDYIWHFGAQNGDFALQRQRNIPGETNGAKQTVLGIEEDAPTNSIAITGGGNIGMGTSTPEGGLHLIRQNGTFTFAPPELKLTQEFFSALTGTTTISDAALDINGAGLWFQDNDGEYVAKFNHNASANSLVLTDTGIGVNTDTPATAVDVVSTEVVPLRLRNSGQANLRFSLINGQAGTTWTFDNNGNQFRISQVGGSSTGAAFRLLENGDGLFAGDVFANGVQLTSARSKKTDFKAVDHDEVLDKVAQLEVAEWRYKTDAETDRHIGPFAEDFQTIFGLGDGKTISAVDFAGVSLSAIKALKDELRTKDSRIEELSARLSAIEERMGQSTLD